MQESEGEAVRERPDPLFLIAQRVPGFGGAYLDGETLVVWLTEPSESAVAQVRSAWREEMGDEYASTAVAVRHARYSWLKLDRWFRSARGVHPIAPSLVFAAIDGKLNRLTFGVASPDEDRPALMQELHRLGIPPEAVNIEAAQPVRFL